VPALIFKLAILAVGIWFFVRPAIGWYRRIFGRTVRGRIWLAREGIVEEGPDAKVLFPWKKVTSFDKTQLYGRQAIRIWLSEDPDLQFRLLNIHLPAEQHRDWVNERVAQLERSKYWTAAQLVLRDDDVDEPFERFFVKLRKLAADSNNTLELPSVLDNPEPLDLGAMGIGGPPTEEE